jgi:hypothetical protein|tara:strand:- start:185 stop:379 length:195 start_codon:yes stop_codon:yes gene_type:complete
MKLRSGKVITKNSNGPILSSKAIIEFNNEIIEMHLNKKISTKPRTCIREIILESLKKGINIKFE